MLDAKKLEIDNLIEKQRKYFYTEETKNLSFRKEQLKKLYSLIRNNQETILEALKKDLGKSYREGYLSEVSMCLMEITHMLKHLNKYSKRIRVKNNISTMFSKSYLYKEPLGVNYIIAPFNYPFQLAIIPLIDSMAAGNTNILRLSDKSKFTKEVITKLLNENFDEKYIKVLDLTHEESNYLTSNKIDHVFFTGSTGVGKNIMKLASENLTKVSLELGGKSPCIVLKDCNLKDAARKIVFGKFLNVGQTCVAADHILVEKSFRDELISAIKEELNHAFGVEPLKNDFYGKIIDKHAFDRLVSYLNDGTIVHGGKYDNQTLKIEPTILVDIKEDSKLDTDEIFGPILPIYTFEKEEEIFTFEKNYNHPLAFYIFTKNTKLAEKVLNKFSFGGGCLNDCIAHMINDNLPFGGINYSGLNNYHGEYGFNTFSHLKPVLKSGNISIKLRFPPYDDDIELASKLLK